MLITPNKLTAMRIVLVPVIVMIYFWGFALANVVCTALFALAGITDWFDGYLARKYQQESKLGAFLDPVADKLIVTTMLVLLVSSDIVLDHVFSAELFVISAMIIVGREITVSALREWMAEIGERANVAVSFVGKVKTTVQMVSIGMLLYAEPFMGLPILHIGELLFYLAAILTLWSMCLYLKAAWPALQKS
ncbi:MAG: CDP-diacylglycerol--glycerol-3-phosphate 3-phosphatidyltransferase [Arenicella sp.]